MSKSTPYIVIWCDEHKSFHPHFPHIYYGIDKENERLRANLLEVTQALRDLYDISGEATIPLETSKAVRRMGKFLEARKKAEKFL
jgi:hypothetical protein